MHYFAYGTLLLEEELRRSLPEARRVTHASAVNHETQFRSVRGRADRGWSHLADVDTFGMVARGEVLEVDDRRLSERAPDYDLLFLTVRGDDGVHYDCFTYAMSAPGIRQRPPRYYWDLVIDGFREQGFAQEDLDRLQTMFDESAECPDFDRPRTDH
ncbi:gamma-glutamylcyclotransferase family protein [Microbacterium sp.]|uniref:gamma-glutamylcyclotransferase family protein n=1 Tax=Microbacterium sp. TaxID=51671 RepID=UPI0039E386CF